MAKLTIKTDGVTPREIELQAGVNRVGRAFSNDFQINAPSISGQHCEITLQDGTIMVRDLGSTNGTFIDNQRVEESPLLPGQVLRLGDVELGQETAKSDRRLMIARQAPEAPMDSGLPVPPPMPAAPRREARLIVPVAPRQPRNFFKNIPAAFAYPFKQNGLILLVSGTVFFAGLEGVRNFYPVGIGFGGIVGLSLTIFITGYLFSYMQQIISTSAVGDQEMPPWPEYQGWWETGMEPWLQFAGIWLVSLGPAVACLIYADPEYKLWGFFPLLILGLIYFPMGLLAVTMYDTMMAMNPMTIIVSMLRAPIEYGLLCLLLGLLVGLTVGLSILLNAVVPIPILPSVIIEFFSLYFLTVEMRLLGLLYYGKREELGWGY